MIFLLIVAALAGAPAAAETPAMRNSMVAPPNYPAACMPAPGAEAKREKVTLAYSVTADGEASDLRVRESTNACFDGPAIDAARLWRFEPRRVNGVAVRQHEMETTLTFVLNDATGMEDTDASPLLRVPPQYPERCMRLAKDREAVVVEFDVTPEGRTENPRIVESTNSCLNDAAAKSVEQWRYEPKMVDGVAAPRRGVQTQTTFELSDSGQISDFIRRKARNKLAAVRLKLLKKNPDYAAVLADLDAFEAEFGADFRPLEKSSFYPLRGAARIEAKNYRGALDDLRIARTLTVDQTAGAAILRTIEQLEAFIAAEDAALAAKPSDQPVSPAAKTE